MANNYYGNRGNGSSLRHYRTKGSRNGYSKNPNYKVVGQKAAGKLVNGRYVYDNKGVSPYAYDTVSVNNVDRNNWQQQANREAAMAIASNKYKRKETRGITMPEGRNPYNVRGNEHTYETTNYTNGTTVPYMRPANTGGKTKGSAGESKNIDDHFTQVGHQAAQSIMNGQRNNWQQQANAHRAINEVGQKTATGQISGFTGWHNSSLNAPGILNDAAKQHAGVANGVIGYDHSYANAVAKNNRNTPEYKAAMRKKVEELSKRGAQQSSVGGHSAAQAQASGILNGRNGLGLRNEKQIQEHYAAKQKTLKGRLDLAKRAANVAMVNAKKKIQKWNPLNIKDRNRLSDPITGETHAEWNSKSKNKGKTKAMTTGSTLSLHGPSNTYNTNLVYDTANQTYHPTNLNGMTHLIANSINNSHATTSNNHAIGGYNAPHTGDAKRQQEAMMRRKSAKGARNDWQKQAASAQANAMAANRVNSGQSQAANVQENKKGFMGILKDKRKTYQMSNKTNRFIGDYVSKKKTESKLTAAEQRRKEDKKTKKLIKKGQKKLNSMLAVLGKKTK